MNSLKLICKPALAMCDFRLWLLYVLPYPHPHRYNRTKIPYQFGSYNGAFQAWLQTAAQVLNITPEITAQLKGAVFEVRQGYKSRDSKRQNADIANAAVAYAQAYLPVVAILSTQMDSDVSHRYENARWLVLKGHLMSGAVHSVYSFSRDVLGYDLAAFFEQNRTILQATITEIMEILLTLHE